MTPLRRRPPRLVFAVVALAAACGGGAGEKPPAAPGADLGPDLVTSPDRPPIAAIVREGDPRGAVGVAVTTEGIAPERGADVAVGLAALLELRLGPEAQATPSWDGVTLALLAADPAATAEKIRRALLTETAPSELPPVQKRLEALAHRPLPDPALAPMARCRGEPFGATHGAGTTLADLERWRKAAFTRARVALSALGDARLVQGVVTAVARAPAWPRGEGPPPGAIDPTWPETPIVVDGAPELGAGQATVTLTFAVDRPRRAVAAATELADARGPLVSRLSTLEGAPRLADVAATAHPHGGCLTVKLDFHGLGERGAARMATAIAVTRQEAQVELTDAAARETSPLMLARRAGDPRIGAERAAFWTLVAPEPRGTELTTKVATAVALGRSRDSGKATTPDTTIASRVTNEIDRALAASREPAVESRVKVERGQADLWLAMASPCGTMGEADLDAGLGGAVALVAAASADQKDGVAVEPIVASDDLGVLAHATAAPNEPPLALAHRVADVAARAFAADPIDGAVAGRVRADLLARGQSPSQRGLLVAAAAVVPGHVSWWSPLGSGDAFGRATESGLAGRASAIRGGPLRVAVLANSDATQGAEAVRAADRWVARRAGEPRTCPAVSTAPPAKAGTYSVETSGIGSEAWIAVPLPHDDEAARSAATFMAVMLDGDGGLLATSLRGGGLAREFGAKVLGPSRGGALVIHVDSAEGALDAAVAQTRSLLDRLRQGAMTNADRLRAIDARSKEDLRATLDPRQRALRLLRGTPLDAPAPDLAQLRAFAAANLKDESLVLVAVRPPRPDPRDARSADAGRDAATKAP